VTELHRRLRKGFERAALDYGMFQKGDRLLAAVSGGADSLTLLTLLCGPLVDIPDGIDVVAVHLDLGFRGDDLTGWRRLEAYFQKLGCAYIMEKTDIGPAAHRPEQRKNPCFLCARQRRKRIFEIARQHCCHKVILGHHRDDIIETFLLNVLFSREISTMVPKQEVFSGHYQILRPMAYLDERLIKRFAQEHHLPVTEEACPTSRTSRRRKVKQILDEVERDNKDVRDNVFRALGNVKLEYLLTPVS
jgi:tRNA 2-thiocytidine biosynthesis protein TtcA